MSQDNGHGRNRDRDGEGRGPSAFNVLLWVSLVSLVILLGYGQAISLFRVDLSATDLQKLIKQSYQNGQPKTSDNYIDVRTTDKPPRTFRYSHLHDLTITEKSISGKLNRPAFVSPNAICTAAYPSRSGVLSCTT